LKRTLLLVFVLLISTTPLAAQYGWIGLFGDDQHEYFAYCPTEGSFYRIEMWIWCQPGQNGQICAEFSVAYPYNTIRAEIVYNELVSVYLGDPYSGLSVCYEQCQYDWHWICHQAIWVADPVPSVLEVAPHPEIGAYQFANCLDGYPTEPCLYYTGLHYNDPCVPGY
jgi:hypothetical protein